MEQQQQQPKGEGAEKTPLVGRRRAEELEISQRSLDERRQLEELSSQLQSELDQLRVQLGVIEEARPRIPGGAMELESLPSTRGRFEDYNERASILANFGTTGSSLFSSPTPVPRCRPTPKPRTRRFTPSTVMMAPVNSPVSSSTALDPPSQVDRTRSKAILSRGSSMERNPSLQSAGKPSISEDFKHEGRRIAGGVTEDSRMTSTMIRRPNIVPDRFNGKTSWRDFLQHFEACKLANQWENKQAKVFLAASLQGTAVKVLSNGPAGKEEVTYVDLKDRLERRFGPGQLSENHLMELRCRRQAPRETLRELGQAIRELATLAYPEIADEGKDRLARGHFSDAIEDQAVREGIFRARPNTLDEAIRAAMATESFLKIEEQRTGHRQRYARVLGGEAEAPQLGLEKECDDIHWRTTRAIQEAQAETRAWMATQLAEIKCTDRVRKREEEDSNAYQGRRPTVDIVCYRCHKKGHYARNCRKTADENPKSENGQQPAQRPEGRLTGDEGRDPKTHAQ